MASYTLKSDKKTGHFTILNEDLEIWSGEKWISEEKYALEIYTREDALKEIEKIKRIENKVSEGMN